MAKKTNVNDIQMAYNRRVYDNYMKRLQLMAMAIFKWEGLEEIGCNARFMEKVLFEDGKAVIVFDKTKGFMNLRVNPTNYNNIYEEPIGIMAHSFYYHEMFKMDEVVYIRNNDLEMPTREITELFAYRLYEIEAVKRINLNALKTPVVMQGSPQQQQTMVQAHQKWDGNEPFFFPDKEFNLEDVIKVHDLKPTYYLDKLTMEKHEVLNEFLTSIGINNANTDKKERLIVSEVESNNDMVNVYMTMFYKTRKKACEDFKKLFPDSSPISVSINQDVKQLFEVDIDEEMDETIEEKEGME